VIGTSPRDRASPAEADALLALDRVALEAGPGNPTLPADFTLGEKRYLQTRTAMADSRGKLLGVLTASIDTSDRKAIEEALAMEQQRLALVVHSSKLGMLDWDAATRTAYYSPRFKEILGYAPDADTSGWPNYFALLHPEDAARVSGASASTSSRAARISTSRSTTACAAPTASTSGCRRRASRCATSRATRGASSPRSPTSRSGARRRKSCTASASGCSSGSRRRA
jgi:PAS domain-containing protein